jgi:hypothetical protein
LLSVLLPFLLPSITARSTFYFQRRRGRVFPLEKEEVLREVLFAAAAPALAWKRKYFRGALGAHSHLEFSSFFPQVNFQIFPQVFLQYTAILVLYRCEKRSKTPKNA